MEENIEHILWQDEIQQKLQRDKANSKQSLEMLRREVMSRAEGLAVRYDEAALKSNDIRMKAPMLFVLLGNQVKDGLSEIQKAVAHNMSNSEGIIYLVVEDNNSYEEASDQNQAMESSKNSQQERWNEENAGEVITLQIKTKTKVKERGSLSKWLEDDQFLAQLNQKVGIAASKILEKNKVFSYWEQMHVTLVTGASDPCNVILPDLVVLIKNKLQQSFKQVFTDLFVLLEETDTDSEPMKKALSYSLFKELDWYQNADYHYERETEWVDDEMKLMTSYRGQLFHLVYILTDKKENGQRINEARKTHYESIVAVNLLKNREQKSVELEEAREQFSYNTFITNVQEMTENRYCTARLAKVRKPGQGIYLSVAYYLFKAYEKELSCNGQEADRALIAQCGLSDDQIENLVASCLPEEGNLEQIYSLISRNISFKELKNETFFEAENLLYGGTAQSFFQANFEEAAKKRVKKLLSQENIEKKLIEEVVSQADYGPFALNQLLTSEAYGQLQQQKDKYLYQMKEYEAEIEEKSNQLVGQCVGGSFGLFDKKYLHQVKEYLVHEVYGRRYAYAKQAIKLMVLESLKEGIEKFCESLQEKLQKLQQIESFLEERIQEANRYEEEYLVQNVMPYYERVVNKKLEELVKAKGEHFLYDEKYMGPSYRMLEEQEEEILKKILLIAERDILQDEKYFGLSFEEELLARANMLIEYEDTGVAAKGELYKLLYESLEENSKPCVHLDTTLSPHRYLEKYFFGNRQSEFIDYAYKRDQVSRSYKIGTISDQRKSVIEKLQLMGGFRLEDLVYTRSAKRYYEAYKEKGYHFHSEMMSAFLKEGE